MLPSDRVQFREIDGTAHPRRILREYGALVDALRARRKALGMSCMDLDMRAGWQEGYANKLENWEKSYGRGIGPLLLPIWLEALGLALIVAEFDERKPKLVALDPAQTSLDLIGGRMNCVLPPRGFTRYRIPSLTQIAA